MAHTAALGSLLGECSLRPCLRARQRWVSKLWQRASNILCGCEFQLAHCFHLQVVAEGGIETAEARLKGLFSTASPDATTAAPLSAPLAAKEHLGKPGSRELLDGVQGERVTVEVGCGLPDMMQASAVRFCGCPHQLSLRFMRSAWRAAGPPQWLARRRSQQVARHFPPR